MHMLQSPAGVRLCCNTAPTYYRTSCRHLSHVVQHCCKSSTAKSTGSGRCRIGTTLRRHCTCNAERLHQSSLLKCQTVWQLEAEVCRVVHKLAQGAMYRWQREKLDVGIQVVPALPARPAHTTLGITLLMHQAALHHCGGVQLQAALCWILTGCE